jgi:hypothetical protein
MTRRILIAALLSVTVLAPQAAASKRIVGSGCGEMRENASVSVTMRVTAVESARAVLEKLEAEGEALVKMAAGVGVEAQPQSRSYSISQSNSGMTQNFSGNSSMSFGIKNAEAMWKFIEALDQKGYQLNVSVNGNRDGNCFSGMLRSEIADH